MLDESKFKYSNFVTVQSHNYNYLLRESRYNSIGNRPCYAPVDLKIRPVPCSGARSLATVDGDLVGTTVDSDGRGRSNKVDTLKEQRQAHSECKNLESEYEEVWYSRKG
jgi:hypothetical protein